MAVSIGSGPLRQEEASREWRRRLKRTLRIIVATITVLCYFTLAPFGYALFCLLSLIPTRDPDRRARRLQGILRRAFAFMHHWLRWIRVIDFHPRRVPGELPEGACVLVANHPSLTDVTAIMSVVPGVCTAVKPVLYDKYWLRPLLEGAGQFSSGPNSPQGTQLLLDNAQAQLARGFRVLIFPEGTRSPPDGVARFGRSAFVLACEAGVPVVPVLVHEEPTWLAKGDTVFAPPAELPVKRLAILPAVSPDSFDGDSRRLRAHVEQLYTEQLASLSPERSAS